MDFKEIKALDDLYCNFRRYMNHVVDGVAFSSYKCLTEESPESLVTKRLEEIKKAAMEYDLKLIDDYMKVNNAGLEYWFNKKVPSIRDPNNIHEEMKAYIEEIKSNYSFGKYPKLNSPCKIGYCEYFVQLVNYTRKLRELYKETETSYNQKELSFDKSHHETAVNEIKGLLR